MMVLMCSFHLSLMSRVTPTSLVDRTVWRRLKPRETEGDGT